MKAEDIDREVFWQQIIPSIDAGRVIPVIGQDLLTICDETTGERTKLYSWMARNVAAAVKLSTENLDGDDALNRVACRLLAHRSDVAPLYPMLNALLPRIKAMPVPEPLRKLAQIKPLDLFVTTTWEPLLEIALKKERAELQVLAYAPGRIDDLPAERAAGTAIFHLFGRLSAVPEYAVTEEDVLEFIHSLGSEARRPRRLFDELADKHLLIIGSCFPDWLARFFIRTSRRERLRITGGKNDFFVDSRTGDDSSLVVFLKNFSTHTQVFTGGDACAFVDELHARWTAAHAADVAAPNGPKAPRANPKTSRGRIFISYASEDLPVAQEINRKLTAARLPVWFDKTSLGAGEKWRDALQHAIETCSVFLPILSKNNLRQGSGEFRPEWETAARIAAASPPTRRFIVPVVVDETDPKHPDLPRFFGELHCLRIGPNAPPSEPGRDLVSELRSIYRKYQKDRQV